MTDSHTPPPRLLRLKEVQDRVGMSKTTIYQRVKSKAFPAPVHLGTMAAWVESEIETWIRERIAERDQWEAA
ncbi:helix-turn-helix transcriptional regulator [Stenotrophomonas rhizophila]